MSGASSLNDMMLTLTTFDSRVSARGVGSFFGVAGALDYFGFYGYYVLIMLISTTFFYLSDYRLVIVDIMLLSKFPIDCDNFMFSNLTYSRSCFVSPSS